MSDGFMKEILLSQEELLFLKKWLGKIVDRGDLLEEVEEDNELPTAETLYKLFEEEC
ncbi:MAG: hypothetical protein KAS32_31245 [Candidatus Peribacteraceae bacterium]|nr:hypothetical protein [Candidatus Peribacteraceae bacterium]